MNKQAQRALLLEQLVRVEATMPTQICPIPEFTRVEPLHLRTPSHSVREKTCGKSETAVNFGMRAQETHDSQNAIRKKTGSLQQRLELKAQGSSVPRSPLRHPEPAGL